MTTPGALSISQHSAFCLFGYSITFWYACSLVELSIFHVIGNVSAFSRYRHVVHAWCTCRGHRPSAGRYRKGARRPFRSASGAVRQPWRGVPIRERPARMFTGLPTRKYRINSGNQKSIPDGGVPVKIRWTCKNSHICDRKAWPGTGHESPRGASASSPNVRIRRQNHMPSFLTSVNRRSPRPYVCNNL